MNENQTEQPGEQTAAYQKLWTEYMAKMMQAGSAFAANPPSPEVLREIRESVFRSLSESWEKFMRSPQFLEGMKQLTDHAINFRKRTNDFMAKIRNEMQAPSRDDVDSIMLSVRHMEKRLLDRMEELSDQLHGLNGVNRHGKARARTRAKPSPTRGPRIAPRKIRKEAEL